MPARTDSYEDRLIESIATDLIGQADVVASEQGPPPDSDAPSEREKVRLWWRTDPRLADEAQRAAMHQMLKETGVPPELLQALLIGKTKPDILQLYAEPVATDEQADLLVRLAEHPFRPGLYEHMDPKERVKEAQRLSRTTPAMPTMIDMQEQMGQMGARGGPDAEDGASPVQPVTAAPKPLTDRRLPQDVRVTTIPDMPTAQARGVAYTQEG